MRKKHLVYGCVRGGPGLRFATAIGIIENMMNEQETSENQPEALTQNEMDAPAGVAVLEFKECNEWEGERWRTGYLVTEDTRPLAESIQSTIDKVNELYQKAWGRNSPYTVRIVAAQQGRVPEQYLKDIAEVFEDEGCYKPAYTIGSDIRNLHNETEKIREKIRDNSISSIESIQDNLPEIVDNRLYKYSDRNYS